jgi:hypothetical protein
MSGVTRRCWDSLESTCEFPDMARGQSLMSYRTAKDAKI